MKSVKIKKGFTLIELLIVIAIIAVLAVALVPTLLGAPAKGRDSSRVSDLKKIQGVLSNYYLEQGAYPSTSGKIEKTLATVTGKTWSDWYLTAFGGTIPADPTPSTTKFTVKGVTDATTYVYLNGTDATPYAYGLYAQMETAKAGNTKCSGLKAAPATIASDAIDGDSCYVILGSK